MDKKAFNFIIKSIQSLPTEAKPVTYHDTTKPGLKLIVHPSGIKTFILYKKIKGRPERITLGRFPECSIENARKKVDLYNAKIAEGINPNQEKRVLRLEITLEELLQQYLERHAKVHKKSWQEDENLYRRYLTHWNNKKLSSISKFDIQKLHAHLGVGNGIYAANRMLALLHVLFNKAIEWGWQHPNPATGIKKFKEKSRDRFIQGDELPRFFEALKDETNIIARDYILVSLLTGARRSNVLAMRWEEINFARNTWTIPDTKNGESHTVPLVPEAVTILKNRQKINDTNSPWVFPSYGASGHLADPKKAWERVLDKAGINNLRIHDLRRSLGSWQAATGANLSIIGKTLAHKNVSTTAIYARLNIDPVRDAMNKATQAMFQAAGIQPVESEEIS